MLADQRESMTISRIIIILGERDEITVGDVPQSITREKEIMTCVYRGINGGDNVRSVRRPDY